LHYENTFFVRIYMVNFVVDTAYTDRCVEQTLPLTVLAISRTILCTSAFNSAAVYWMGLLHVKNLVPYADFPIS
jgi:hypothetical protein